MLTSGVNAERASQGQPGKLALESLKCVRVIHPRTA